MEELFKEWLASHTTLSANSVYKYSRAIVSISNDMISEKVLSASLYTITSSGDLTPLIKGIYSNASFMQKDKRGNKMYSNALNHYYDFLKER